MMSVEPIKCYDSALEEVTQAVSQNRKAFTKVLNATFMNINSSCQYEADVCSKIKGEITEVEKKIESLKENVESVRTDKDRTGREKQKIQHECDQLKIVINEKIRERDELKEMVSQHEQRLKEKEQMVESEERKNQEKISNMEKGMLLYQTHLGLKIQRSMHNSLVMIFTQVNRSDPTKEYHLDLTIDSDSYRLISSSPPIPNLPEIERRLNETNNFSGCIHHIRNLFQKMDA